MASMISYRQCELTKPVVGGISRMVTWLPEKYATVGEVVKLRDGSTGTWSDGWRIDNAGPLCPGKLLERQSREHATFRDGDI